MGGPQYRPPNTTVVLNMGPPKKVPLILGNPHLDEAWRLRVRASGAALGGVWGSGFTDFGAWGPRNWRVQHSWAWLKAWWVSFHIAGLTHILEM